jgi:uncharacterized membrane protein required for colicin V production
MALIRSVGGLLGAVNNKADAILGAAKGILCLPSILTGLPGIAAGLIKGIIGSAAASINNIISGISSSIDQIIAEQIDQIVGSISSTLNKLLQAVATIVATIRAVLGFIDDLKDRTRNILKDARDADRCRYAAATLLRCITSQIANELSKDLRTVKNIKSGNTSIQNTINNITNNLKEPGNVIDGYLKKATKQVDRATKTVNASSLI